MMKMARMKTAHYGVALAAVAFAGSLLADPARAEMSESGTKAMQEAGRIMFEHRCRSCHSEDPATPSYGPSLIGVLGRKAGSLDGYQYSDALKNSGLEWNEASLRAWIENNTGLMPGTRMKHVGITDRAEQDFILAYIKTLVAK